MGGMWVVKMVWGGWWVVHGLHRNVGGEWGCDGVWKYKWAMWTTKFNETW
jgi:hypothetical protein